MTLASVEKNEISCSDGMKILQNCHGVECLSNSRVFKW